MLTIPAFVKILEYQHNLLNFDISSNAPHYETSSFKLSAVRSNIFLLMQVMTYKGFAQTQINYSPQIGFTYSDEKVFNADINHDGNLDIILYNSSSEEVTALKHNGNNNANGMQFGNPFSIPITSESLIDVKNINDNNANNTDQEADLITYKAGITYDEFYYYKSTGSSFLSGVSISNNSLLHANYQFGTFDIDNDGDFDIYALDQANSKFYYGITNNLTVTFSQIPNIPTIPANATVHIFSGHFQSATYNDICYVVEYPNNPANSNYNFQVLKNNNGISLSVDFNSTDNNVSPNRQFFAGKFTTDNFTDIAIYESGSAIANINGYIDVQSNVAGTMFSVSANHWQSGLTPPNNASFLVNAGNYSANSSYDDMIFLETSATLAPVNLGNSYLDINTENNSTFTLSLPLGIAPCNANPIAPNLSTDFHIVNGDFNQDNIADFVLYNPTDHVIKAGILTTPPVPKLDGYCWPLSAAPSETIDFFISGAPLPGTVDIYRYESRNASVDAIYVTSLALQGGLIPDQTANTNSNAVQDGCGWNSTVSLNIPNGWPSGYYAAVVTNSNCARTSINFIVKSAPNNQSGKKLLLLANTNTWAAYNTYSNTAAQAGSKYGEDNPSKYQDYSFMRPVSNNNIASNDNTNGARAELWIYTWLKDNGFDPDVVTDMDVHVNAANFLNTYDYLVMGTHPEYWTGPMYDHVKDFQANGAGGNGGNLICLGGNAVFEVVDIDLSIAANPRLIAYPNNPAGPVTPNTVPQQNAQYPFLYLGQLLADQVGGLPTSSPFISGADYKHDRFDYFLESYNFGAPGGPIVNKRSIDLIGTHYMNLAAYAPANANTNASYTKANIVTPLFNGVVGLNGTIGYDGYSTRNGVVASGGLAAGWECDRYTEAVAPYNNAVDPLTFNNANLSPYTPASPLTNPASIYANDILVIASTTPNQYSNPQIVTLPDNSDLFLPNGMNNSEIIYVRPTCTAPNKHGFVFTAGSICFGGSLVWNYDVNTNTYNNDLSRLLLNVLNHINFDANISNVTCSGGNTGSIVITQPALYAANSINYLLQPGNVANTTGIFTNLAAGTYSVSITIPNDSKPITLCREYTISEPSPIVLSAIATNATCNGANGLLTFTASGGTGNISFTINGVAQNSPFPAPAGIYTIIATDANNCIQSTTITIVQPVAINIGISNLLEPTCNGLCNATAQATASGGIFPYTYSISAPGTINANTGAISGLCAGAYTVTATDANGCTATTTINITQPTQVSVTSNATAIPCNGQSSTITVAGVGGTPSYDYSLNGGPYQAGANFTGNPAGNYTITVKDANGCTATTTVTITQPTQVSVTASSTAINCNGGSSTITATGVGGTPAYEYSLDGITYQAGTNFAGNPAGNYTITVKDANGCTATTTITIVQPIAVSWNFASFTNIICNQNGTDGTITVEAIGGTLPFTYTINPNNGTQLTAGHFASLPAGSYTITATDANGCSITTYIELIDPNNGGNFCCSQAAEAIVVTPNVILKIAPTAANLVQQYGNVISNKTFYIDDIFTVDVDITFDNCILWFTPSASVQVTGNSIFTAQNNTVLQASCDWWGGIEGNGAANKVSIQSGSTLKNATYGIQLFNNAIIEADQANFTDNGMFDIYLENMTLNTYPGYIKSSNFNTQQNLPGVQFNRTWYGIYLNNVKEITIGEANLNTGSNSFDGMYTGIFIANSTGTSNSKINIYNNTFSNIQASGNDEYGKMVNCYSNVKGAAIFSKADGNPSSICHVDVQNTLNNNAPYFSNCDKAIISLGNRLDAKNLKIYNCLLGIMCQSIYNREYSMEHNFINNAHMGIHLTGDQRNVLIDNNTINAYRTINEYDLNQQLVHTYAPIGIKFQMGIGWIGANINQMISNNTITINRIAGVGLFNSNAGNVFEENGNSVIFNTNSTASSNNYNVSSLMGYYNENNYKARYIRNTTVGPGGNQQVWLARTSISMFMNHSRQCKLDCNRLKYTRFGFFVWGNNTTAKANVVHNKCNANAIPWFFLDNGSASKGTFGDVGDPNLDDNANEFISTVNPIDWRGMIPAINSTYSLIRLAAVLNPVQENIYTAPSLLQPNESISNIVNDEYLVGTNPNGFTDPCAEDDEYEPEYFTEPDIDSNEYNSAMAVAQDSMDYINFPSVGSWIDRYKLYLELDTDSLLLNSSPELQYFYNTNSTQTIGDIKYAAEKIAILYDSTTNSTNESLRYAEAIAANSLISSANDWEMNEKKVNDVLLFMYDHAIDSIPLYMKEDMQYLAASCPFVEGTAVYRARTIYSLWEPNAIFDDRLICIQGQNKNQDNSNFNIDSLIEGQIAEANVKTASSITNANPIKTKRVNLNDLSEIKIYPNPASTYIIVEYNCESDGELILYNYIGQEILKTSLEKGNRKVQMQITDVANGIYQYKCKFENGIEHIGKLTIEK